MSVLSNVEFEKLVVDESPRLKAMAKHRCDQSPTGFVSVADLQEYSKVLDYSGDRKSATFIKNVLVLHKNGTLTRVRSKSGTWEDHVLEVTALHAAKEIPFNIGQPIYIEDLGKYGSIVDYIPSTEEYLVVLDPFQVKQYKKKDLTKVAQVADPATQMVDQVTDQPAAAKPATDETALAQKMRHDGYTHVAILPAEYGDPLYARSEQEANSVFHTQYPTLQPNIKTIDDYLSHL